MTPHSEDFARTDGAEGPLRVLVADDDLRSQRLLAALLDFAGACPVIASDGSEALEAWRQARWDLILMDVKMPFLDGLALTRIIRHAEKTEPRERTAILGVTACATWQDQKACLAAGAPLAAVSGGGLLLAAACVLAWRLLASRPSDFETIVAVARGHRLTALRARRIWAPLNGQWRRPRQYRVVVRDRRRQLRSLQVAFPVLGRGPVWVRLSLDGAPEGRS